MIGNMRRICDRAEYLSNLASCYQPFAQQLTSLANSFQDTALIALLERYLSLEVASKGAE